MSREELNKNGKNNRNSITVEIPNLSNKKRKISKQELRDKKKYKKMKKYVKIRNRIIIILYIIFAIYIITTTISWKNLIAPMIENNSSVILDLDGEVIETLGNEKKHKKKALNEIPDNLKNAYIDIEDERFYKHKGVDIKRTVAAIGNYVIHFGKSSFGGSSITQQLVKNLTGDDSNSIGRKVGEWWHASTIESFSSKDEILEAYLNIIYVGPNVYGVGAGAKYYFDKDVSELSLAECAYLAGINNSPNSYNPFKNIDNSEKIKNRSKAVLKKMKDLDHINNTEYEEAVAEIEKGLKFKNGELKVESDGVYSYHADAVINEIINDLVKKKHIDKTFATNYLNMAGLKIYSTQDSEVQKILENEYKKKENIIKSDKGNSSQSASVIIDHKTGSVFACVGGLGEKTTVRGFNRATQAVRQTGSASKPLAVLVPGLDQKKFTATTMYTDEPTTFKDGVGTYSPTNNEDYIGNITVRRAVESSQNIPFVKMMEAITPKKSIKYLKEMGISTLTKKDETLSLALGGLEKGITPLEMAGAYATIANNGQYIEPTFYSKVENANGKVVMKSKQKTKRVMSNDVASILQQILKQPVEGENGTAKICKIDGFDIAAKTGTTNDNYDKWLCGFSTYCTTVTWYGYDSNESIVYKGKSPAAIIWSNVMKKIHKDLAPTKFEIDKSVKMVTVCSKTGLSAGLNCQDTYTEYYKSGTVPNQCSNCSGSSKTTTTVTNKNNITNNKKATTNTIKNSINQNKTNTNTNSISQNKAVTNVTNSINKENTISNNTNNQKTTKPKPPSNHEPTYTPEINDDLNDDDDEYNYEDDEFDDGP